MHVKLNQTDKCPAFKLSVTTSWQAWSWLTVGYDDFKRYARPYSPRNTSDELVTTFLKLSLSPADAILNTFHIYMGTFSTTHPSLPNFHNTEFCFETHSCVRWEPEAAAPGKGEQEYSAPQEEEGPVCFFWLLHTDFPSGKQGEDTSFFSLLYFKW